MKKVTGWQYWIMLMVMAFLFVVCTSSSFVYAAEIYTEGQILGEFNGWEGDTVIELNNGTSWQQIDGRVLLFYYYYPIVTIIDDNGAFYAQVYDTDQVRVQQVW